MKTYTRALIPRARSLRSEMTDAERVIWTECLRQLPIRFRRQRPFGPYIVDFYCASRRLVIEIDGDSHSTAEARSYDEARTAFLNSLGLRVIRFTNNDVIQNTPGVVAVIKRELTSMVQREQ